MSLIISTILIIFYISAVFGDCGSQIKTTSDTYFHDKLIYNGSINDCGCTSENICVRKCCASNFIYSNESCVFKNGDYLNNLTFYKNADLMEKSSFSVNFVAGSINCSEAVVFLPEKVPEHEGNIQSDGQLFMRELNIFFGHKDYCVDYSEEDGIIFMACFDQSDTITVQDRVSFIGMMVSLPFFLITFIVYALLPERNLHAMCLMSHVFAIFVAYFSVGCMYLSDGEWPFMTYRVLLMIAICCFMVSIFWVNVMAFEICSAFSRSGSRSMNKKQEERRRFIIASIYAWGIPLLFISLILIISKVAKPNSWYDPGFRGLNCTIREGVPMLLYYYGPLAILIISNIVMFIMTACKIRQAQKDTVMLTKRGSKKHGSKDDDRQMFQLYIRLLFMMGLNWSMEIINWAVNWQVENVPPAVWYVTDVFNALYGIVVFILFVCKKNIWKALKKRYYKVMGKHQADITTGTTTLTD